MTGQYYNKIARVTILYPNAHLVSNWDIVVHYTMTQLSMKAGLKWFKDRGEGCQQGAQKATLLGHI